MHVFFCMFALFNLLTINTRCLIYKKIKGKHDFLADRAFQRCKKGPTYYKLHCPKNMKKNQNQLTKNDSNETRAVTLLRNIIERSFGRRKIVWGILNSVIPHQLIASGQFIKIYKIIAAIDNCFFDTLSKDKPEHDIQLQNMKQAKSRNSTKLLNMCKNRPKNWEIKTLKDLIKEKKIPKFKSTDLYPTICGIFSYNLSRGYLNKSSELKFETHPELPTAIKVSGLQYMCAFDIFSCMFFF